MESKQLNISLTMEELMIITGSMVKLAQTNGVVASERVHNLISRLLETVVENIDEEEMKELSDKYKISIM